MKCLILNGWSDDNKGDSAIVLGLIRLLDDIVPNADISILSQVKGATSDPQAYRFVRAEHPSIRVIENPVPTANRPPGVMSVALATFAAMRLLCAALLGYPTKLGRDLSSYDLAISKGGHIIAARPGVRGFVGLFLNLFPLILAQRLRVPVIVFGQSIGPVSQGLSCKLVRVVLSKCVGVWVRDRASQELLRQMGVESRLCPDTAFYLSSNGDTRVGADIPYIVITIRQWAFPYLNSAERQERYDNYLLCLSRAAAYWVKRRFKVYIVAHTVGPSIMEDDRVAARTLYERLDAETRKEVTVVTEDLAPRQLMSFYGGAHLVIGTRFHSVIMSVTEGVPAVAISYHGTKATILGEMGYPGFVLSIDDLSPEGLLTACQEIDRYRAEISWVLSRKVEDYRQELRTVMGDIIALTAKGSPQGE